MRHTFILVCALVSALAVANGAEARNLYVSPGGDDSDGTSWKKAFKSFTSIDWDMVASGDQLVVDGGESSTTYSGAFTIPRSNIVIRQAGGKGRSGQVIITGQGQPQAQTGVTFGGSNIHMIGRRRSGIKISYFAAELVRIQTGNNSLRNVELGGVTGYPPYGQGRVGSLVFGGQNNHFINCDFRESTRCAVDTPVEGANNLSVFNNCTFGNNGYGWWGEWGVGIYGNRTRSATNTIYARHCVFGSYLNKGVEARQGRWSITDSLFLGSSAANLSFEPTDGNALAVVRNCTLYEPNFTNAPPSQYRLTQYNIITNGTGTLRVRDSIVYGGEIHVPVDQVIRGGGNVQFHVTGNTTALASALVDPQFVQESQLWKPITGATISPRVFTTQSYVLSPASPALGKGSSITDVTSIVPAYGPIGHLPPLGGP